MAARGGLRHGPCGGLQPAELPRATLFDASERDFRAALAADAVSQTTEERLADLERIGVRLHTTEEALAALSGLAG